MTKAMIRLLGRLDICDDGIPLAVSLPQKAGELLAYLLVGHAAPHYRVHLATLLWNSASEEQARSYLRKTLWQLQSSLPFCNELIAAEPEWIGLQDPFPIWIDTIHFERAYHEMVGVPSITMSETCVETIGQATALYRGDLLEGCDWEWCFLERDRFASMNEIMLDKLVEYSLVHGQFEQGLDHAHSLLRFDQARERTHRLLMWLYLMVDNRTAALRQYQRCREILQDELSVEPAQETVALYEAISNDQPLSRMAQNDSPDMSALVYRHWLAQVSDMLQGLHSTLDSLQEHIAHERIGQSGGE